MATARQDIARQGELAAEECLARAGFVPLARNLRVGRDEADLVMRDPDGRTIVVVEVKARTSAASWPEERIDRTKQRHLLRLAMALAARAPPGTPWRVDAVGVTLAPGCPAAIVHHTGVVEGHAFGR